MFFGLVNILIAQVSIVSTSPQNNATNVPLNPTITITFNKAINQNFMDLNQHVFTNIDSSDEPTFSEDLKIMTVHAVLKPNKTYFVAFLYLKGLDGSILASPEIFYFTTGTSFPTLSISGTVHSGATEVSPENAVVGIATGSVMQKENPDFVAWSNVNANGSFTIPYISDGTYWPVAAKDVDMDGSIDPSNGVDVIALGDSIIVNGSSITKLDLTFILMTPLTFHKAIPIADSLAKNLPQDRILKSVRGHRIDTLGTSEGWGFIYTTNNNTMATELRASNMGSRTEPITDQGYISSLISTLPLANPNLAAASSTVISNVENEGGRTFRLQSVPDSLSFQIEMTLGDLSKSEFWRFNPDQNSYYWGVRYSFGVERPNSWQAYKEKYFLCNYSTGVVLQSQTVGVEDEIFVPGKFLLEQNYPNPFNPATVINYQLPVTHNVSVKIYNILGKEIATLVNEVQSAGKYSVTWNSTNMPSGIYFYRLQAGTFTQVKKMLLLK